jgi:4-deoxy-L-threo-5-hexosulose-uronate ketol-isomerase
MIKPTEIGKIITRDATSASERAITGKAIVPESNDVRELELFDATPVWNSREEIINADNSTFQFLSFHRTLLDVSKPGYKIVAIQHSADQEAVYYVNRGQASVTAGGIEFELNRGDAIYVGIGEAIELSTNTICDISEFTANECHYKYPIQLVRHSDIEGTPLAANVGTKRPMTVRTVYKLVDSANVKACRLLFGDTFMEQAGSVGSYPPHFHGPDGPYGLGPDAKEEIYHYRCVSEIEGDTPYVLQNCAQPGESVGSYVHIFDEYAMNVTQGYHDTMAPPPVRFMFTWCLCAFTENVRDWSRVLNKPGYDGEW